MKLSADPERTVSVPLTKANQGGATSADYSVPNSIVFKSGDTEKTYDLEATDDESVNLTFGGLPTAVSEGPTNQTVVNINDNAVCTADGEALSGSIHAQIAGP